MTQQNDIQAGSARPVRVLILTATIGAGHNSATAAIIEGLKHSPVPMQIERLDLMTVVPRWFRAYYASGYEIVMIHLPRLYGVGYALTNHPSGSRRGVMESMRMSVERLAMRKLARRLCQDTPDLIVNTHFLAAPMIGRMIEAGRLRTRQVTVITDVEVHRMWYASSVEHWFVASEYSGESIQKWGIAPADVTVTGIPIHPKWNLPLDKGRILAEWGLPADKPVVVLTGGTEFTIGPIVDIAREILQACPQAFLVVLAGRDKNLLGELSKLAAVESRLKPVAFTDRSHELLEAACVMLTKPGGITTTECLAKGLPMILMNPVPGHEGGNAEFYQRQGAAVIARGQQQIVSTLKSLLDDPQRLAGMSSKARALSHPSTPLVAEGIVARCKQIYQQAIRGPDFPDP
ncbi:MAG: hypothetical protein LLG01_14595 [Planctomycetaceae bacterium]|nr:hypothetical protein [Planctomycetaceae bacterium]